MQLNKLILFFLFLPVSIGYAQDSLDKLLSRHNSHSIPYISVEELRMLHNNNNIVILDAREREEFEVSHIEGAVFVSYSNFSAEEVSQMFKDKNTPFVVYCSLGIRSENISEKLKKSGFTNVRNLYGGIFEWKNNGYSVVEMQGRKTEKVHAYSPSWGKWLKKGEKVY
jgi:rhodanese-related sulfurtransferase